MTEDFDSRMLLGIMQSKVSPFNTQSNLEMNPVDFIARFICDLSEDYEQSKIELLLPFTTDVNKSYVSRTDLGKIFNLYNPNRVKFDHLVEKLEDYTKINIDKLPFNDWKIQILPKLGNLPDPDE